MNAQKVIESLTGKGFSFRVDEGKLVIRPKADDDTREILRQHKAEIVSLLLAGESARQGESKTTAAQTPTGSKETSPCSPNEEILNRLEAVSILALQHAGKLKDFSPEQKKIADLLDRANDLEHLEPLDVVKLAAVIGELEAAMKPEPKKVDGKIPPDDQTEYRNERAAILAFSANLPSDEAEYRAILERPCNTCRGRRFWVSVYDVIICGTCHPPAMPSLVKRWIEIP